MVKLKTKTRIDGVMCFNASQRLAVSLIFSFSVDGILISMIKSVSAIANTASQKASNLELWFGSAIFWLLVLSR